MSAEATFYQCDETIDNTPDAAVSSGEVRQMSDGRAGVASGDNALNTLVGLRTEGIFTVLKTASICFLDGGKVYWDHSANKAHFKKVNDRDFYIGIAVGDSASTDTTLKVNLNELPNYTVDLVRDPYITTPVGTAALNGFGTPYRDGGALRFNITATSEAQKTDAISVDGFSPSANPILEVAFRMPNGGSAGASDFSLGLANASNATDADLITDSIFFHMDGGATLIKAECDDGTNETNATTTVTSFVAGTAIANRVEGWIDCRDLTSIKFYLDGVRVASGTTFSVAAAVNTYFLLAHVEKTTGTETADMVVDWMRVRLMQQ